MLANSIAIATDYGKNLDEKDASVKDPCGGGLFQNISLKDTTDPSKVGSLFSERFENRVHVLRPLP